MKPQTGNSLATWSIMHPIGVSVIALAVIILGAFSLSRLSVDLNPRLIYPEILVRILDSAVPATVMEDRFTRQLEEQLAITEDVINIQSRSTEGVSSVNLSFEYGKDIDLALRDASIRLDRAKRFLPDTDQQPIIYKRDPSQIPVLELVISSSLRNSVELRRWVDHSFGKWFVTLPGVAAAEVGGGLIREIHIRPDPQRLAGVGLSLADIIDALQRGNREDPAGRLIMKQYEISTRIDGRLKTIDDISSFPLTLADGTIIQLHEIAEVIDTHEDERLRVRLNGQSGVKLSIQKQPAANTVAVADSVQQQLQWLHSENLIPDDITIKTVADQSTYIRRALGNTTLAAVSGAILAMLIVYLFLGDLRRTLIIGSAIPIAIMVTFVLMGSGGLTLNIMTLGGLALGVGLLVDNTIVMLENISRHQAMTKDSLSASRQAVAEVNSAIVAATSTNLAAVLPFLFVGGITGLLFRELIFTISAAILASLLIAITLVPALASRISTHHQGGWVRHFMDRFMARLQTYYQSIVKKLLRIPWLVALVFILLLAYSVVLLLDSREIFLPSLDDGRVSVYISADPGTALEEMDESVQVIEALLEKQVEVEHVFTIVGGFIFGRTEREISNHSTLKIQLTPLSQRVVSSREWIRKMTALISAQQLVGIKVRMRVLGIRGIRTNRGDDDISLRIRGNDLQTLKSIADALVIKLATVEGLHNVLHSADELRQELSINIDRQRASALSLDIETISEAVRIALEGIKVTDFIENDQSFDVRLTLPQESVNSPQDLDAILLFPQQNDKLAVYLGDIAEIKHMQSPAQILRDNQQRIVEITASLGQSGRLRDVLSDIQVHIDQMTLPEGYTIYDGGTRKTLQESRELGRVLLYLALFLVFVVMAVQYESLINPFVILFSVPFALIGVVLGLQISQLAVSMPVWLGLIMLAGIVVNNAIILVEYIEIERHKGMALQESILSAARLRLRPILMTTLTTVFGMLPLAMGMGEGAEMLQPLAVTIVSGLSFSLLVSLVLVPVSYYLTHSIVVNRHVQS
ncbi:MAG: efflux RND transporter permease subunit [Gammaproteobacteria bacterium]